MRESFTAFFNDAPLILMEGALGERLKREYRIPFHPALAMADLWRRDDGRAALRALWSEYAAVAARYRLPLLLTTPTRRLNRERIRDAGIDGDAYAAGNVAFLSELCRAFAASGGQEIHAGALMGCRGDAYTGAGSLGTEEARDFHIRTAEAFARAGAEFLLAGIMPTLPETIGMARAMAETGIPYIISFTIRADGCLIDGTTIDDAIAALDADVSVRPVCYMANCVHPRIVSKALSVPCNRTQTVRSRFLGIQANTSPLPYEALDGAADLHTSSPQALAADMLRLKNETAIKLFGGCCGTDARHLEAIAAAIQPNSDRKDGYET